MRSTFPTNDAVDIPGHRNAAGRPDLSPADGNLT